MWVCGASTLPDSLSVSNDKGKSLSKRKVLFVGNDTPLSPQVYINYSDGKFNIKWNTPKGIHAAYLDTLSMRYTVKRYPDEVEVAKEISTNSFEDAVPLPSTVIRYYYTVTASCNGKTSQPGKSNIVQLGSYNLPYLESFDNQAAFEKFVVVDANQDRDTWKFSNAYYTRRSTCVTIAASYVMISDDWLISPPVNLEKGKTYNLSADFVSLKSETQPEARYEAYLGKEAASSAMTIPVSGAFDVPNMGALEAEKHTWSFTAKESGSYHIGIHCITPSNGGSMCLDNLSVSRALAGVPDSVSDLQVKLDDTNGWKAIIKGKAPLKDVDGNTLQSIDIIKVFRDGRLKKVISDITPGDEFSLEDTKINVGKDCRWDVVCNNSKGDGKWSELHLFLNDNNLVPEAVENLKVKEISETKYEISWTPPAYNRAGELLDPKKLKYIVNLSFNGNRYPDDIYTNYGDTCYTFTTESKQKQLDISVMAANANGKSVKTSIPKFLTGDSYKLPYRESFTNGKEWSYIIGNWRINNNTSGIESADDDNGYVRAEFSGQYRTESLYTGKIDLGKASHPYFSFYLYNIYSVVNDTVFNDTNELEVFAREEGKEEWVSLLRGKVYELCGGANATPNAWHFMRVGLDRFKGKRIRLQMTSTSDLYGVTQVDRLVVADAVDRNLGVNALRGPAKVRFNKDFILTARVENRGVKQISEYDVAFYRDGAEEPFEVVPGVSLAPEGVAYLSAHDTLGINLATKPHKYKAVVRCENDADPSDNTTSEITVKCEYGPKATLTSLSGDAADKVVSLAWNAPVVTSGYSGSEGAESFENYDAWAYENVGDWTFLDVDQQGIGSFNLKDPLWGGYHLLDIPNSPLLSKRSFIVIKNGHCNKERTIWSLSGFQFFHPT